ncbi:MAG: phospholipase D-like domain-containing protein [Desulfobia sp.]
MRTTNQQKRRLLSVLHFPVPITVLLCLAMLIWPWPALCLTSQLDINTASEKNLRELPFIGSSRAKAITDYRKQNGSFENLKELLQIQGIGKTSLKAVSPYLTINGEKTGKPSIPSELSVQRRIDLAPGALMLLPDDKYYEALIDFIREAEKSIDMAMYLFKITDSPRNLARMLMEELIRARKRGVMINLVLEQSDYNDKLNLENRKVARKLKANRINVQFDGPDTTSHTKVVVIDRCFTFLGSHNFTHSALSHNHEMSILIDNRNLAEEMIDHIDMIDLSP